VSLQMLVILVPLLFAFMGFAIDLGRMYMIRGELKTAADAMALAAAARLIGTEASLEEARAAAQLGVDEAGGFANRYDYGGLRIGATTGRLSSEISEPSYYDTFEAAAGEGGLTSAGGTTARHVRITLSGDAPLIFWSFLPVGQERRTPVRVSSVAGVSAPLCLACGIDGIVIAAPDATDTVHFGLTVGDRYTLGYVCNGQGAPGALPGTIQRLPYLLLNRLNEETALFTGEDTQTFRMGAGGLPSSTAEAMSCVRVDGVEQVWATATPLTCQMNNVPAQVTGFVCGLATRLQAGVAEGCANIAEADTAAAPFAADTDNADVEDYASYTGNLRRILTIGMVDSLGDPQAMTVLGFRQFLLQPVPNVGNVQPNDSNGRFIVTYIGNPVPLSAGRFSGCSAAAGPGKVVLHQ
jgi:hypothetical protein